MFLVATCVTMTILRPIPPSPSQFAMTSFPAPTKMHYQKIPRARASASARREAHTHFWRVVERFPSASPHLAAAVTSRTSSEVAMHSAVPVVGACTGHSPSRFPIPITKPLPPPGYVYPRSLCFPPLGLFFLSLFVGPAHGCFCLLWRLPFRSGVWRTWLRLPRSPARKVDGELHGPWFAETVMRDDGWIWLFLRGRSWHFWRLCYLLSCGGNGKRKQKIETQFDTTSSAKALAGACVPTLPSLAWSCVWRACTCPVVASQALGGRERPRGRRPRR